MNEIIAEKTLEVSELPVEVTGKAAAKKVAVQDEATLADGPVTV